MDADEEEEEEEDDDDASRGELLPVDKGRLTLPSSKRGSKEREKRLQEYWPLIPWKLYIVIIMFWIIQVTLWLLILYIIGSAGEIGFFRRLKYLDTLERLFNPLLLSDKNEKSI